MINQQEKARILIVDDEKMNLKVLADLLKDDYAPILAISGEQALQHAFGDSPPDLVLLDVVMPQMGGYEVIKNLKNHDKTKNIPVIFVTALSSVEDEEHGLRLGAVDYITKPYSPPIVKIRILNHLRLVHQYKLLDQLAYLDGLTEIPNRRRFDMVLETEWARSVRNKTPFSLAMVDVDFFKQYNDHYGHAMGDLTLQKIAKALKRGLNRPGDFVARYGGEEFVIVLPETDVAAQVVAERLRQTVVDCNIPHQYSQVANQVSVSVGLVTIMNTDNITTIQSETILKTADQNLYLAKKNGRNQIVSSLIGQ